MSKRPAWPALRRASGETDDELIDKARQGDSSGFDELYRRHRAAAESTARWMLRSRGDVDDVVSDAFAGVLAAIRNGNGPRDNFRSYLLAAVRNGCRLRGQRHVAAAQRPCIDAGETPMFEDPERYVEADTVARAFASLNPRWQQTLWLTEVEQRSPAEVATHLNLAPNATAALTLRAREAFATAYLAEHVSGSPDEVCERYGRRLAAYVRDQLTDLQRDEIERHLVECQRCQLAVNELSDVNSSLRKLLPPVAPALAAPWTVGTTLGTVSNLFSSGLLLKGATALLVATPLLVLISGPGRGGAPDDHDVSVVVAAPYEPEPEFEPVVVTRPLASPGAATGRASAGTTTTTIAPAERSQPTPEPVVQPLFDDVVTPVVDGVVVPVVEDVVMPVVEDVVIPVVEDVVVPVVEDVVVPVVDGVVVPVVDELVVPVVDGVVAPVVDGVVVPVVEDVVAPVVEDVVVPIVEDVVVPVVDGVAVPVIDEVVGPVVDGVVAPVVEDVVVPVIEDVVVPGVDGVVMPVVDGVLAPVIDDVVVPVVDDVVLPVVDPVVDDVVLPVVDELVDPVVDDVVAPVVDELVDPVVDDVVAPVVDELVDPVVDDVVAPVVDELVDPVVDDVVDPVAEVVEPVVDPIVEDVVEPVVDPIVEDVVEPVVDPVVDPVVEVLPPIAVPTTSIAAEPAPVTPPSSEVPTTTAVPTVPSTTAVPTVPSTTAVPTAPTTTAAPTELPPLTLPPLLG